MGTAEIEFATPSQKATKSLPEYAAEMNHFHCAFATELKTVVDSLPLTPEMHVIDVGCGDGFYMELFASHLDDRGTVTGLDCSRAYLEIANRRLSTHDWICQVRFVNGALNAVPLPDSQADLAWCAQSLFSLPEPCLALRQMAELVHPGGFVAVLENDTLHQLLLPWPPRMELALRTAELAYLSEQEHSQEKYYIARRLPAMFVEAGLEPLNAKMQCSTRQSPFGEHLLKFLDFYLDRLSRRVEGRLDSRWARQFARMTDRDSDSYLLRQPSAMLGWLNTIVWGRRPCQ
jgi:ubiquinone/menaquinone biosynthesis C-methylase UbiE